MTCAYKPWNGIANTGNQCWLNAIVQLINATDVYTHLYGEDMFKIALT